MSNVIVIRNCETQIRHHDLWLSVADHARMLPETYTVKQTDSTTTQLLRRVKIITDSNKQQLFRKAIAQVRKIVYDFVNFCRCQYIFLRCQDHQRFHARVAHC